MTDPIRPTPTPAPDPAAVKRAAAAQQFEAVFAGQLAKLMLEQVEVDTTFGGGHGELLFRGVMAEEIGNSIAATGQLGLASAVAAALQRMEERK